MTIPRSKIADLTYVDAITDKGLLGLLRCFGDTRTWSRWIVFLKAIEGLPLTSEELAIFKRHSGRQTPRPGGYPESLAVVGRQSGKSQLSAAIQAVNAVRAAHDPALRGTYAATVGQDSRGATRAVFAYISEMFADVPMLAGLVVSRTADTITLVNDVRIAVYPCRPAALRGIRCSVLCLDELAHYFATDARPVATEMLRAAKPTLLTTHGRLVLLTTPYASVGPVFDLFRRHWGRDDSPMLVWKGTSLEMHPGLDAAQLERLRADDPEAYESEINAEFRSGLSLLFDADAIEACVDPDVRERPFIEGVQYRAGVDLSGGRRDRAALAIAHRQGNVAVLDLLRVWPAPHDPATVIGEASETLKAYRISEPQSDAYAAEFATGAFRDKGISLKPTTQDRSGLFLSLLPMVNSGRVRLLDHPLLCRELTGLERRRGTSGKDRVDHRVGAHDDAAVAAAIALTAVGLFPARPMTICELGSGRILSGVDAAGNEYRGGHIINAPSTPYVSEFEKRPGVPCATVKIVNPRAAGFLILNASDFDPNIHRLWRDEPAPQPTAGAVTVKLSR
jgi:hypothetical protein